MTRHFSILGFSLKMPSQLKPLHYAFHQEYESQQRSIITYCGVTNSYNRNYFRKATALWDTGATTTVINPNLAKELNLIPSGRKSMQGVHGSEIVNTYIVDIGLPNELTALGLNVSEANIGNDIGVLIGMDIIGNGDFAICNAKVFSFALPSFENPVNFVAKSNKVNERIHKRNQKTNLKK